MNENIMIFLAQSIQVYYELNRICLNSTCISYSYRLKTSPNFSKFQFQLKNCFNKGIKDIFTSMKFKVESSVVEKRPSSHILVVYLWFLFSNFILNQLILSVYSWLLLKKMFNNSKTLVSIAIS
jgi:hypothetical protein